MEICKVKFLLIPILYFVCLSVSKALDCQLNFQDRFKVAYGIVVDQSGRGNFRTVQSAIDSIPFGNQQWIRIQINGGIYWEKVTIPNGKSCIFLDGGDSRFTQIHWNAHETTSSSATFSSLAENIAVRGITFRNTFNSPGTVRNLQDIKPALAAEIEGDKVVFYRCGFIGLQDTLWDGRGRHYYVRCYIEGVIDIISGYGQSLFERCEIRVSVDLYAPILSYGYITAQGRETQFETNGFVFKRCTVDGSGRAFLGRAYRPYSTVVFFASELSGLIDPAGWDPWHQVGHEFEMTYAEVKCYGAGADTSRRVPWFKRLREADIRGYIHIYYIDKEGWIPRLPHIF